MPTEEQVAEGGEKLRKRATKAANAAGIQDDIQVEKDGLVRFGAGFAGFLGGIGFDNRVRDYVKAAIGSYFAIKGGNASKDVIKQLIAEAIEASPHLDQPNTRPRSEARKYLAGKPSNVDDLIRDIAKKQQKHEVARNAKRINTNLPPYWPAPTADRESALRFLAEEVDSWLDQSIRLAQSHRQFLSERSAQHDAIDAVADFPPLDDDGEMRSCGTADDLFSEPAIDVAVERRRQRARKISATKSALERAEKFYGCNPRGLGVRKQINAPAGSGKTRLIILGLKKRLADLEGLVIWIALPDTDMMAQVHSDLREAGIPSKIVRGREAKNPAHKYQSMCVENETASAVTHAGLSPKEKLCPICPAREQCREDGYLSQETTEPGIYLLSHQYLVLPKAPCPRPDLVIVDETHWQIFCKHHDVFPEDIGKPFAAGSEDEKSPWATITFSNPVAPQAQRHHSPATSS